MTTKNRSNNSLLKTKKRLERNNLLHNSFEIGILIKGVDGVLEVIGGFLLILINPVRLNQIVVFLTQHELSEDPNDIIANYLVKASHEFSIGSQYFGVLYLLTHGIVKLFLFAMLRRRKLWAYPLAIIFLGLFIGYQIYRFTFSRSVWLVALTIFDIIMIFLTWSEYRKVKIH